MLRQLLLALIRGYRYFISPLLPPSCRYYPSCSSYAVEAIEEHGAIRGGAMAIWRILRCNPFSHGGHDPVPTRCSAPHTGDAPIQQAHTHD